MKRNKFGRLVSALPGVSLMLAASCASRTEVGIRNDDKAAAFGKVKPVLERNCLHCHGSIRLPGMPAMADTRALGGLIGSANLIVPGKPEQSRFHQVVAFSDDQAGAMPPTGHAVTQTDAAILKDWIQAGAPLPDENIVLHAAGKAPRSR